MPKQQSLTSRQATGCSGPEVTSAYIASPVPSLSCFQVRATKISPSSDLCSQVGELALSASARLVQRRQELSLKCMLHLGPASELLGLPVGGWRSVTQPCCARVWFDTQLQRPAEQFCTFQTYKGSGRSLAESRSQRCAVFTCATTYTFGNKTESGLLGQTLRAQGQQSTPQ